MRKRLLAFLLILGVVSFGDTVRDLWLWMTGQKAVTSFPGDEPPIRVKKG